MKKLEHEYDVFISHAVEDKIPIANELYGHLAQKKLKVWYSGNELSVGDRLTDSIHKSLDKCRFGVVIISPTYLSKIWALNEFFFLLSKEKEGQKVILPVLYDITPEELAFRSPLMADIFAVRASKGVEHVTEVLYREIQKQSKATRTLPDESAWLRLSKKNSVLILICFLLATVGLQLLIRHFTVSSPFEIIEHNMREQINSGPASDFNSRQVSFIDYAQPANGNNIHFNLPTNTEGNSLVLQNDPLASDSGNSPNSAIKTTLVFQSSAERLNPIVITVTIQFTNAVNPVNGDSEGAKTTSWKLVDDQR